MALQLDNPGTAQVGLHKLPGILVVKATSQLLNATF